MPAAHAVAARRISMGQLSSPAILRAGNHETTTTPAKEAPPNGHFSKSIRKLLAR